MTPYTRVAGHLAATWERPPPDPAARALSEIVMLPDVLFLVGFAMLATGLALWSVPLALAVVGALLLAGGLLAHRAAPTEPTPPPDSERA